MEQTTQQTIQKPSLPIKTKIAAWWMRLIGIVMILLGIFFFIAAMVPDTGGYAYLIGFLLFLVCGGFICFLSSLVAKGKKWAWWAIFILFFTLYLARLVFSVKPSLRAPSIYVREPTIYEETAYVFSSGFSILILWSLIPSLLLLLLDRKNFWKIAS